MAIDSSIALGYRPPQVNLDIPSPIHQFGQLMTLRGLMEQQQLRRMEMEQEGMKLDALKQANAGEMEFRRRMQAGENLTPSQTYGLLGSQRGPALLKGLSELEEQQIKTRAQRSARLGSLAGSATDEASYRSAIMQGASEGLFDQETARQLIGQGYNPKAVRQLQFQAMTAAQQDQSRISEMTAKRQADAAAAQERLHGLDFAAQTVTQDPAAWEGWLTRVSKAYPDLAQFLPQQYSPAAYGLVRQFGTKPSAPPALMPPEVLKQQEELHGSAEQRLWTDPGGLISIINDPNRSDADKRRAAAGLQQHESLRKAGATQVITPNQNIQNESKLRDDYYRDTKEYVQIRNAYNKIKGAAASASAAGDMSLIYGFMRMQDPGSTVREGEFATAQNAGGIPERIRAAYNNAINGERLDEAVRKDFVAQAEKIHSQAYADYGKTRDMYTGIATRGGMDPRNVVIDYSTATPAGLPRISTAEEYNRLPSGTQYVDAQTGRTATKR